MPFTSKSQQKWMFVNKPEMAKRWAKETPDFKKLPEHVKKKSLKKILKKHKGKGGPIDSSFKQASNPINLLRYKGEPPTAQSVPKSKDNYLGNKLTK